MDNALLSKYVVMETDGSIQVGRGKPLQDTYLQKLVTCMEELFYSLHKVTPTLVGDFNQHVYRSAGYVAMSPEMVTMETRTAVEEKRLFRCLICSALSCVPEVGVVMLYDGCGHVVWWVWSVDYTKLIL